MDETTKFLIAFGIFAILAMFVTTALPMILHYRNIKKEYDEGKLTAEQATFRLWNG